MAASVGLWLASLLALACICIAAPTTPAPAVSIALSTSSTAAPSPPGLDETLNLLRNGNITKLVDEVRDPSNKQYLYVMGMIASLMLCLMGYHSLRIWLFLGGFISLAGVFYALAPSMIHTDICCGPETQKNLLLICLGIGVAGGLIALWILKIGIFMTGSCLGLAVGLAARTILGELHLLNTDLAFAIFYATIGFVGGMLALYKEKPIIVALTAFGGAFGFFVGVGYFQKCDFMLVGILLREEINGGDTEHLVLTKCNRILLGCWVALAIIGVLVQYNVPCMKKAGSPQYRQAQELQAVRRNRKRRAKMDDREAAELIALQDLLEERNERRSGRSKRSKKQLMALLKNSKLWRRLNGRELGRDESESETALVEEEESRPPRRKRHDKRKSSSPRRMPVPFEGYNASGSDEDARRTVHYRNGSRNVNYTRVGSDNSDGEDGEDGGRPYPSWPVRSSETTL
eukprot:m.99061 g.99061  ORF g.99061 m.99061 type:complete len:460 (+) comp15576_c0_seq1:249-1628(+)